MGERLTLGRLVALPVDELKTEWTRRYGAFAPNLSPELLQHWFGFRLQEQRRGGLSRENRMLLRELAAPGEEVTARAPIGRRLLPGTRLVRDWHGKGHTVVVLEKGFEYDGKHWNSLTAVARAITGIHWNGPRFFGLAAPKR